MVALLLLAGALAAWEGWWRVRGYQPSIEADDDAWILQFDRVEPDSTIVVGTSRIQAALDPETWVASMHSEPPIMLQLPGGSPLPLLERLAEEGEFHGLVLFDFLPMFVFDVSGTSEKHLLALLDLYDVARTSPARRTEALFAVHVGGRLVFRNSQLMLTQLLRAALKQDLPNPGVSIRRPGRFGPVSFKRMDPFPKWDPVEGFGGKYLVAESTGRAANEAETVALLARLESCISKLQAKGARVIAMSIPSCGERARIEERRFPTAQYWDRFVATTSATTVKLDAVPGWPRFDCYDGSHIDSSDSPQFTRFLAGVLQGLLAKQP
ncbi:MAG: hypothetical protein K8S98_11380 [Planctomycetes bacterium]|nr:hypothetical protein [Planctomycetota bacterium]